MTYLPLNDQPDKNLLTVYSESEPKDCHPDVVKPKGIPEADIKNVFNEYQQLSKNAALAFLASTGTDLSFMSAVEFNKWTELGLKLLRQPQNGEALCLAFFSSGIIFLKKDMFHNMETWVALALEIHFFSPETACDFLKSTPEFLTYRKPFELKQRAQNTIHILKFGENRGRAASSFLLSSSKMHGFMFSLVYKEWLATGLVLSKNSAIAAADFFEFDPDILKELYQTEIKIIFGIVASISQTSCTTGVDFYQTAIFSLLRINPNIREDVLKTTISVSGHTKDIPATFSMIIQALKPHSNPLQEHVFNQAKKIERLSDEAALNFFRTVPIFLSDISDIFLPFWVENGIDILHKNTKDGIRYFSLVSQKSMDEYAKWKHAVRFEDNKEHLTIFANALCGKNLIPKIHDAHDRQKYVNKGLYPERDGYTIVFPPYIAEEKTKPENLRLYKIFAAHHAGYIEFKTFAPEFSKICFLLETFPEKELAFDIFYIIEDGRIDYCLKNDYKGLAPEIEIAVKGMLEKRPVGKPSSIQTVMELLLRVTLNEMDDKRIPDGLRHHYEYLKESLENFYNEQTDVWDVFKKTCEIYPYVSAFNEDIIYESIEPLPVRERPNPFKLPGRLPLSGIPDKLVDNEGEETEGTPVTLSPEALEKLFKNIKKIRVKKSSDDVSTNGLYLPDLDIDLDGGSPPLNDLYNKHLAKHHRSIKRPIRTNGNNYTYDEWDYLQGEYRKNWCCLREKEISGHTPNLYHDIFERHSLLIRKVKRQFQQIRPALLETVRGVEQGDELYMPAVIQGVVDRKAGNTPTERIFVRKEKKIRRIATLLLVDMSASTGEKAPCSSGENLADNPKRPEKRVIDIEIESLVVVIEALNALDDDYAVYGFSGQGKDKVDFYKIKDFKDTYSENLKKRISGIEPKQSTRMGTAIRHAYGKLKDIGSDHKLLILLSDGFPQDLDYGENRKSREYALNDTMMALIEAAKEGIKTFCITIDQAGNDYLRKMCNPGSYLVIKDIYALPEILPKVVESLMV